MILLSSFPALVRNYFSAKPFYPVSRDVPARNRPVPEISRGVPLRDRPAPEISRGVQARDLSVPGNFPGVPPRSRLPLRTSCTLHAILIECHFF